MNVRTMASEPTGSLTAVASIVHDLRNPLATIHGSAEMLVGSSLSTAQVHRIARNVYCASVRMREMLDRWRKSVNAHMPLPNPKYDPATADQGLAGANPPPARGN